jgi:phage FluMu protein Com
MSDEPSIRCLNCGTKLAAPAQGATSVRCTVCGLLNNVGEPLPAHSFTRDSFEYSLGDLIVQARASGLTDDEIIEALRDELEFAAELVHAGRQMYVQIIDLGPQEGQAAQAPAGDRATLLRSRAVGG